MYGVVVAGKQGAREQRGGEEKENGRGQEEGNGTRKGWEGNMYREESIKQKFRMLLEILQMKAVNLNDYLTLPKLPPHCL